MTRDFGRAAAGATLSLFIVALSIHATTAARLQFAAASVRPAQRALLLTPIRCRGVDGELSRGFPIDNPDPAPQGRCTGSNVPVGDLIAIAYASTTSPRVIGIPDSLVVEEAGVVPVGFQIQATAENPSRVTKAELQQMLRTLLMDRFKAEVRRETREMDGFVMTIAKSGIKFKETMEEAQKPGLRNIAGTERDSINQLGGLMPFVVKGNFRMSSIQQMLESTLLRMPVADKTGLLGVYDITVHLYEVRSPLGANPRGQGAGPRAPEFSPPIPRAFDDQLGLRLEPGKVPVEFLIVDHIEKPSEN